MSLFLGCHLWSLREGIGCRKQQLERRDLTYELNGWTVRVVTLRARARPSVRCRVRPNSEEGAVTV